MKQLISSSIKITSRHGTCFAIACQSKWIKTTVREMEDITIGLSIYTFYVQSRLTLRQRSCTYFFLIWVWNLLAKQLVRLLFQLTNEALYLFSFWYTCTQGRRLFRYPYHPTCRVLNFWLPTVGCWKMQELVCFTLKFGCFSPKQTYFVLHSRWFDAKM